MIRNMSRSIICAFLTRYDQDRGRREFVHAVKNCRTVRSGAHSGKDGRALAVALSRDREKQMYEYLRGAVLVPVPTSGAGVNEPGDSLWSGMDLARALARVYSGRFLNLLRRHTAIDKSSSSHRGRSLRRHVESIELTGSVPRGGIVLIDDVVTSGSTMCGCAELLLTAAPGIPVRGFAVAYVGGTHDDEILHDFAAREYEWHGLDARPRNRMIPSPLSKR